MNPNAIMAGIQTFGAFVDASYQNDMIDTQNSLASAQAAADANVLFASNTVAVAQASYAMASRSILNRRAGAQLSDEALAAATTAARTDAAMQATNFEASIAASEQMGQAMALGFSSSTADAIALSTALRNARQRQYLENQRADVADSASSTMARLTMQVVQSQDLGYTAIGQQFQRPVANKVAGVSPVYAMLKAGGNQMVQLAQEAANAKAKPSTPLGVEFQTSSWVSPTTGAPWTIPTADAVK